MSVKFVNTLVFVNIMITYNTVKLFALLQLELLNLVLMLELA